MHDSDGEGQHTDGPEPVDKHRLFWPTCASIDAYPDDANTDRRLV